MFFFMNLSEAINNKHLQHLDFKQGPPPGFTVLAFTLSVIYQLFPLRLHRSRLN